MSDVVVREVLQIDHPAIRDIEIEAFAGPGEADLVEALRAAGAVVLELVAERNGRLVGHVLFSRLAVASETGNFPAVALAPLAVSSIARKQGIGSLLVREAHRRLEGREKLSVVLGEPAYYGRFGYTHQGAARFDSDYQCEALQALAWGDAPEAGRLVYAAPFREL